jgi:aminopeptidase 2
MRLDEGTGDPTPEEDETLWYVPLELKIVDKSGKATTDHKAILESRQTTLKLDAVAHATYKLNAETSGVCKYV